MAVDQGKTTTKASTTCDNNRPNCGSTSTVNNKKNIHMRTQFQQLKYKRDPNDTNKINNKKWKKKNVRKNI